MIKWVVALFGSSAAVVGGAFLAIEYTPTLAGIHGPDELGPSEMELLEQKARSLHLERTQLLIALGREPNRIAPHVPKPPYGEDCYYAEGADEYRTWVDLVARLEQEVAALHKEAE